MTIEIVLRNTMENGSCKRRRVECTHVYVSDNSIIYRTSPTADPVQFRTSHPNLLYVWIVGGAK